MDALARGEITLCPVNDAYTVSVTPSSCVFNASFDGSSPDLTNATVQVCVCLGADLVPFEILEIDASDGVAFNYATSAENRYYTLSGNIASIPSTSLSGFLGFRVRTLDAVKYEAYARFSYSVVRESTMLDWIQDWEGSKTKIGGTYIMTPKLFVGKKEDVAVLKEGSETEYEWVEGALTGVYIGPDLLERTGYAAGIYGYLRSQEIFHLNAEGGFIGGWTFNDGGLQSGNGVVNILSAGSIYAQNPESVTPYWGIYADGTAQFANGNVKFYANGDAEFEGEVTATGGSIGGWEISSTQIYSQHVVIDSARQAIGCFADALQADSENGGVVFPANPSYGVAIHYASASNFGIVGRTGGETVFSLGSSNFIAGWSFNHQAIWTGSSAPYLTQGAYADNSGELTMAPNGLRGYKWYIDANGTASFAGGAARFYTDRGEMFGWLMRAGRLSSSHAALISESAGGGLYVSPANLSEVGAAELPSTIAAQGGIYMAFDGTNAVAKAYDSDGNLGFKLGSDGTNSIGNWNFNHQAIYIGSAATSAEGFTSEPGSMVLATTGIIGNQWKLMADGSGAVANGKISWDAAGNVTFDSTVSLSWANLSDALGARLTYIDANGIYTGTLTAININADELLSNGQKWALKQDGSGYLASKNIEWDTDGNIGIRGSFSQDVHYAYKCDATVISNTANSSNSDLERMVTLKLNSHLYIATNACDPSERNLADAASTYWPDMSSQWPYALSYMNYYTVQLPVDTSFIGKEIKIYDCNFGPFSRSELRWCNTTIVVNNSDVFSCRKAYQGNYGTENIWTSITIRGGCACFVCMPSSRSNGVIWVCTDFYGSNCSGVDAQGNTHLNLQNDDA